jgi:hypothetical protein
VDPRLKRERGASDGAEQRAANNRIESSNRIESQEAHKTGRELSAVTVLALGHRGHRGQPRLKGEQDTLPTHQHAALEQRSAAVRVLAPRAPRSFPPAPLPAPRPLARHRLTGVGGPDSNRKRAVAVAVTGSGRPHEMSCPPGQYRRRGTARGQAALMPTHQTAPAWLCPFVVGVLIQLLRSRFGRGGAAAAGWMTLRLDRPTCLSSTLDHLHLAPAPHDTIHRRTGPCHDLGRRVRLSTTSGCLDLRRARLPFEWGRGSFKVSERRRGRFDSRGLGLDGSKRLARSNCAASERERPHACMPQGRGLHALGGVRVGTCARGLGGDQDGRCVCVCVPWVMQPPVMCARSTSAYECCRFK